MNPLHSRAKLLVVVTSFTFLATFLTFEQPATTAGNAAAIAITLDTAKPASEITAPAGGWSFRNHVIPVLTRLGCNSGACHGAAAGKGGFKLTLRGYDPEADFNVLTRQSLGRRVNKLEPAKSLMLLKPTMAIGHGGGKRMDMDSLEYKVLVEWIANGMAAPAESDVRITRIEVGPNASTLASGGEQQLRVLAQYSDGHAEDVTRWVKYSSTDPSIAIKWLPAEAVLDAISQVTGVATDFPGYPAGMRAMQLPDARVNSYFPTRTSRNQIGFCQKCSA